MKLCFMHLTYCTDQLPVTVTKSVMRLKQKGRVWTQVQSFHLLSLLILDLWECHLHGGSTWQKRLLSHAVQKAKKKECPSKASIQ